MIKFKILLIVKSVIRNYAMDSKQMDDVWIIATCRDILDWYYVANVMLVINENYRRIIRRASVESINVKTMVDGASGLPKILL
tara:strand:+ start:236 stop:484 length:249 start_codon:yes stop_codon:yes gene_type:complete